MHARRFIIQIIDHFQKQGGGFLPKSGSQKSKKLLTTYTTLLFQDSTNPISTQYSPTQTPLTTFFDKPPLSNHPHIPPKTPHIITPPLYTTYLKLTNPLHQKYHPHPLWFLPNPLLITKNPPQSQFFMYSFLTQSNHFLMFQ